LRLNVMTGKFGHVRPMNIQQVKVFINKALSF
jgi:hypothetical protein